MERTSTLDTLRMLAARIRRDILVMTTRAGSGHPSSSLSAADLMTGIVFGGAFRFDVGQPERPDNDRLIFSKGHASPLFYALWAAAGAVTGAELLTLRQFGSPLEGHPTTAFRFTEASTGSLGQGLSVGLGMALNAKYLDRLPHRTWVLLGDSEMAEGSVWEALQAAAFYRLDNLVAVLDVNRLGQRGETMFGHDTGAYAARVAAFDWETLVIDGHDMGAILKAGARVRQERQRPLMIIARTIKGRGVSLIEDKNGWHGKVLKPQELERALEEIGPVDTTLTGGIGKPPGLIPARVPAAAVADISYPRDRPVATRRAYGNALKRLFPAFPDLVVLDGEVGNSTYAEIFEQAFPGRFFQMYIAEQNMVGAALGLARRGKIPFVSTFAAFLTRAFDQIRMSRYSDANITFCGSHAGVSIGEDGASQMGLEDIAMFRTLLDGVVLYPADAVATERLVEAAARHVGIVYLRTTRMETPILYDAGEGFPIGGCKVLRSSPRDVITVVAAGVTLHEALAAHEQLLAEGCATRLIDLYCIKPIDARTLREAARATRAVVTVEDHFAEGGLGEAVRSALAGEPTPVVSLAVRNMPKSGKPAELLDHEEISAAAIVRKIKELL